MAKNIKKNIFCFVKNNILVAGLFVAYTDRLQSPPLSHSYCIGIFSIMSRVFIDKPPNGRKYHHDAAIDNRQFHGNHAMSCPAVVDRKPVNEKQQQQKAFHY